VLRIDPQRPEAEAEILLSPSPAVPVAGKKTTP
jgi:hypothetical protein